MKNYYLFMSGRKQSQLDRFKEGGFIGVGYGIGETLEGIKKYEDLCGKYPDLQPHQKRALGAIRFFFKDGDVILTRTKEDNGKFFVGYIEGGYLFGVEGGGDPHRRKVKWLDKTISLGKGMSTHSATIRKIKNDLAEKIERLIENGGGGTGEPASHVSGTEETESHVSGTEETESLVFAKEEHLRALLIDNWNKTELGKGYEVHYRQEDDEVLGEHYRMKSGAEIDILARRKDGKGWLVVELKKGTPDEKALAQTLRYMGEVQETLCGNGESVRGAIVAYEKSQRLEFALSKTRDIDFYRYEASFSILLKK